MIAYFGNQSSQDCTVKIENDPYTKVKSTAISDAGITKQTLYEIEKAQFNRATYERAVESLNAVNGEIEALIQQAWGR